MCISKGPYDLHLLLLNAFPLQLVGQVRGLMLNLILGQVAHWMLDQKCNVKVAWLAGLPTASQAGPD